MKRLHLIAMAGALGVIGAGIAWACAGGGYETSWEAEASTGILGPHNDTRSNFILLLADRYGTKVADPAQMEKGIVPFDFPYAVMLARLSPPAEPGAKFADEYAERQARYGLSDDSFDYTYGSDNAGLCHSNRDGAAQFNAALAADPAIPANEKAALAAARNVIAKACDKAGQTTLALDGVRSAEGSAFANYVEGARLFYAEDLDAAAKRFAAVGRPTSPWLVETASYMLFRTALAQAAKAAVGKWGEVIDVDKRDLTAVDRADAARQQFLKAFPQGRYATSARDLSRRIAWLRGDSATLGRDYSAMLSRPEKPGAEPDLDTIHEIDRRIMPSGEGKGITDPTLLAVLDLMRLRPKTPEYHVDYEGPELSRAELEQQRPHFKSQSDLFGYLLAAEAYYHRKQPREVLALIPDAAHQARFSYTQFSRQVLRGLALEAVRNPNARSFWLSLLPGAIQPYQREAIELAIFRHDEKAGVVGRLVETGSPILHPLIRQKIIEDDAGIDLLRRQATGGATRQQREVSLYLLLTDELHHGLYREFIADRRLVGNRAQPGGNSYGYGAWSVSDYEPTYNDQLSAPPLYVYAAGGSDDLRGCPDIGSTAASLAVDSNAIRPRLCLAEFIRRKGFDNWGQTYDYRLDRVLSRSRSGFPGKQLERMDIYRAVLESSNATPDDKAFALNRAVRCYQPTGSNSCGGDEVEKPVRKAWFDRLKNQYASSAWAKELKYYW